MHKFTQQQVEKRETILNHTLCVRMLTKDESNLHPEHK